MSKYRPRTIVALESAMCAQKSNCRSYRLRRTSSAGLAEIGMIEEESETTFSVFPPKSETFSVFPSKTQEDTGPKPVALSPITSIGDNLHESVKNLAHMKNLGKSLDKLSIDSLPSTSEERGFRIEKGLTKEEADEMGCDNVSCMTSHALLEDPENETRWYFKFFLGKVHQNYLGYDAERQPFFLSIVFAEGLSRAILWQKRGSKRLSLRPGHNGKPPSSKAILEKFGVQRFSLSKEITNPQIQQQLITLEEQEGAVHFKFGVLYAKAGQSTDEEMLSNEKGSPPFESFLDLLGARVQLKDYPNYRGGLDNKNDSTGTHSVYTTFEGHEIMFHVSTLLPYHPENKQQVERKRHIGNDIVVIIYMEDDSEEVAERAALQFDPLTAIRSHFNHIFAIITHNKLSNTFKLVIYSENTMREFSPPLPVNGLFNDHKYFRDFLLAKLINGEKATYALPVFSDKRERTLDLLIKGIEQEYRSLNARRTSSGNVMLLQGKKAQETNFAEVGQKLKVERYLKGTHPTSGRTTATRNNPWEPHLIVEDFTHPVTCGDFYDDTMMVVATPTDGTFLLYRDGRFSLLIDKSVLVVQLVIAHKHDLLIFRTGSTKENYVYIVPLPYFHGRHGDKVLDKSKLSQFRVSNSKGVSVFCTTPLEEKYLRLFVAAKNKLYMWMWKHTADSVPKALSEQKIMDSLQMHRETCLSDVPVRMTMKEEIPSGKLFVAYKNGAIDMIDEITVETKRFLTPEPKSHMTSLALTSDGKELVVGYNVNCRFCPIVQDYEKGTNFELFSEPHSLVHVNTYIFAFNSDSLEVRLARNGSIIQNLHSQEIKLLSQKRDILFVTSQRLFISPDRSSSADLKYFTSDLSSGTSSRPGSRSASVSVTPSLYYIYKISYDSLIKLRGFEPASRTISVSSQMDDTDGGSVYSADSNGVEIHPQDQQMSSLDPSLKLPGDRSRGHSPARMCMKRLLFFSNGKNGGDLGEEDDELFPVQVASQQRALLRSVFYQHDESPDSGLVPDDFPNASSPLANDLEVLPLESK